MTRAELLKEIDRLQSRLHSDPRLRAVTHDLDVLEEAVPLAVPRKHRADLAIALSNLLMAVADEFTVKQQTGYVVGIAVGRALHPDTAARIGAGWTPRKKKHGRRKG